MQLLEFYMLPSQAPQSVALHQQKRLWPTALSDQKLYDEAWASCAEVPQCSEPPPVSAASGGIFPSLDFWVACSLLFIKPEGLLMEATNCQACFPSLVTSDMGRVCAICSEAQLEMSKKQLEVIPLLLQVTSCRLFPMGGWQKIWICAI